MKTIYFDCAMGAAGDMLMASLLELHPDGEGFLQRLNAALEGKATVTANKEKKCGISATHVRVVTTRGEEGMEHGHEEHHHHNGIRELLAFVEASPVSRNIKDHAAEVYTLLAKAESHVHGEDMEHIHFHELGSLDALADILGVCMLMEELAPERVLCSPIHVGSGTVHCAHGELSVPAPATAHILRGVPIYSDGVRGELCTPTGAALLKHFAEEFCPLPSMEVECIGVGCGTKDFDRPNIIRTLIGRSEAKTEQVLELSCNIDDMTAEAIGYAQEELLRQGALDVYTVNIGMKKCRPAVMLCCICQVEDREKIVRCMFANTSTLGIRENLCRRYTLQRCIETENTEFGQVRIKKASGWGVSREKAEYEDLARLARESGISLGQAAEIVSRSRMENKQH